MTTDDYNPIQMDNGFYFDTRPDTAPIYHYRVACEAGRIISEDDKQHTYDLSELSARKVCPECDQATAAWQQ